MHVEFNKRSTTADTVFVIVSGQAGVCCIISQMDSELNLLFLF